MKTYKVLIAEDDAALLSSIRIRLGSQGYEIFTANDGYQAVALARKHLPDLLLLDINMPAGDGFTVEDRVRKIDNLKHVPVIYITGDTSQRLSHQNPNYNSRWLLRKPFETNDLLQTVQTALEENTSTSSSVFFG